MPRPRNESPASAITLVATISVEKTISGATRCGSRCDRMIRRSVAPVILAASTNSFSRSERIWERMILAG